MILLFGITNLTAFLIAALFLNLTPGVDTLYVLGKSLTGGPRVGLASAFGISSGLVVHTLLVAFGLSLVLMRSAWLFWVIKLLGACYLVYLGARTFLSKQAFAEVSSETKTPRLGRAYVQGVITNVMNPKVALFFLAFLPQFVDPSAAFGPKPFLILGLCFIATSTLWSAILALGAGQFKRFLDKHPRVANLTHKATGLLYILLGISIFATPIPELDTPLG